MVGIAQKNEESTDLAEAGQYVSFSLAGEEYGIPIMRVQEIIRFEELTQIPQAAEFVSGVLNLRGKVIPVIDLRCKFSLDEHEVDRNTRIVVVEAEERTLGMILATPRMKLVLTRVPRGGAAST